MDEWFAEHPGFISRSIAERPDGSVLDIVLWATMDDAEAAFAHLINVIEELPFYRMIDLSTLDWSLVPVVSGTVAASG
jgi:hypothetical protein